MESEVNQLIMLKALFLDIVLSAYYILCCCMFTLGVTEILLHNKNHVDGFLFWFYVIGYALMALVCGVAAVLCVVATCKDAKEYKKNKWGLIEYYMFDLNNTENEQRLNENYINWQKNFVSGDQFSS